MPIPEPESDENREDFIGRCIPLVIEEEDLTASDEDDRNQAIAICFSQWREAQEEKSATEVTVEQIMAKQKATLARCLLDDIKAESLDERMSRVRQAWIESTEPIRQLHESDAWVREIFDDHVIVEDGGDLFKYPYEVDDGKVVFGDAVPVETEYVEKALSSIEGLADRIATKEGRVFAERNAERIRDAIVTLLKAAEDGGIDIPGWGREVRPPEFRSRENLVVKILSEDEDGAVVGGLMCLFADGETKDLQGEYFTPETKTWHETYKSVPALFHHGLDDTIGLAPVGKRRKAEIVDDGLWVEDWLDKSSEYWDLIEPLLEAKALYYSPGSAPHLVRKDEDGRLLNYPVIEDTLTVTPAQHRLRPIERIKAAYKSVGLNLPEALQDSRESDRGDAGGASRSRSEEMARAKVLTEIEEALIEIEMEE